MECTNGEWPCAMSTHLAWLEKVNVALLEVCKIVVFCAKNNNLIGTINEPPGVTEAIAAIKLAEGDK